MAKERDDPRGRTIAERLVGYLDDGEAFLVRGEAETVRVFDAEDADGPPSIPSRLREEDPELYGHLLRVQSELERAGSWLRKIIWLLVVVAILGLVTHLLDNAFETDLDRYRSFWVYVGLLGLAGFATSGVSAVFGRLRYATLRGELQRAIDHSDLDRDALLAKIAFDDKLSQVLARLRSDSAYDAPARY